MDIMTRDEAAQYLRITTAKLRSLAKTPHGPTVMRLGHRTVRYLRSDLDAWIRVQVQGRHALV